MAECIQTVAEPTDNTAKTTSSYVIKIVGTEHGSWQGQLEHIQTGTKTTFRSCLEMLRAMESAIQPKPEAESVADDSVLA